MRRHGDDMNLALLVSAAPYAVNDAKQELRLKRNNKTLYAIG